LLVFSLFDCCREGGGGTNERMRDSLKELEQERARLLSENAVLEEEVKELQRYIDSHLGRLVSCCLIYLTLPYPSYSPAGASVHPHLMHGFWRPCDRAHLLSKNAVLEEEVKELQRYTDSHLGRCS